MSTSGDAFAILGLERRFDLDPAALANRYDALAQKARSSGDGALLAHLDAARQTLADPARRAGHLLDLPSNNARERRIGRR